jgi:5'-deoxynucleotidase YfbR-like HD superfamily hydrolase
LVSGLRKSALVAALICLAISAVSCRTIKEVQIVTDTVVKIDTTEVFIHDTTKVVEVKIDSVDRLVEKITYVDSNGVWHEKEKETLTHYIFQQSEEYKVKEAQYKSKISELEKKLEEKAKVEYVEKKLNWYQKTMITLGWCFVVSIIIVLVACLYFKQVRKYFKLKRKVT